mgnify:CR=1 FL=1
MRILDEKQLYQPGDKVTTHSGLSVVVRNVMSHSVYYEARPIASYLQFTYVAECSEGQRYYLKADEIASNY